MIEVLRQQFNRDMDSEEKINRVREALQISILKIMYNKGYFDRIAFVGGTALRFLHGLKRFSEDLDFSLIDKKKYNFSEVIAQIEKEFKLQGLGSKARVKREKCVNSIFLKFSGLLKTLGLSSMESRNLSIKIEIDTNPPPGWNIENTLINKIYLINLTHYDLSSLYAGKLHACLFRKFSKGRDFYDLIWYLSKAINPNYKMLNNAIERTQGRKSNINESNFCGFLMEQIENTDFDAMGRDVERFLEDKDEAKLINFQVIKNLLLSERR